MLPLHPENGWIAAAELSEGPGAPAPDGRLLHDFSYAGYHHVSGALFEVAVEDLGIADAVAWDDAWAQDQVHVLELNGVVDGWIRSTTSATPPRRAAPPVTSGDPRSRRLPRA